MYPILLGIEVILAIVVIFLILVYRGKGADVGAVFTGSSSMFGAKGAVPFTTKLIGTLCAIFIINSLALTYTANRVTGSVVGSVSQQEVMQLEDEESMGRKESSQGDIPRMPTEKDGSQ